MEVEEGAESVRLPFQTTVDLPENAELEWWRYEPEPPMTVHKKTQDLNQPAEQNQFYRDRTEMNKDSLKTGDLSLTLKYPTDRDSGRYICRVRTEGDVLRETTILLKVNGQCKNTTYYLSPVCLSYCLLSPLQTEVRSRIKQGTSGLL